MPANSPIPDFEEKLLAKAVEQLSPEQIHTLPFGAIKLDSEGTAIFYSDAERRLSGFRREVVGHKFFTEIAPCMNNPTFKGRIERALEAGKLDIQFGFTLGLPVQEQEVDVRVQSATSGGCWIFMRHNG